MPNNIIKSFSKKSNKSEQEIENLWDELKSKYGDDYQRIVGTMKKILHINENTFIQFLKEKDNKEINEVGTYAAVKFEDSEDKVKLLKELGIPNVNEDLHCTLLYSRKNCPNYVPINMTDGYYYEEAIAYPDHLDIFKDKEGKNCLVLILRSGWLTKRHKDLMKEHNATYDFPKYNPHITLSYDIGAFDYKNIEQDLIKSDEFYKLVINEEYKEDLHGL